MKSMILALLAAAVLSGCATQRINWSARIGNYTYDQAVMEFGTPDKSTKLSDGSSVVEWLTEHSQTVVKAEPVVMPSHPVPGPTFTPDNHTTYFPGRYLQLIFGTDGKLNAEKEYTK